MKRVGKSKGLAKGAQKPADIACGDWEAADVPEATDAEFAAARPFAEVFPAVYQKWKNGEGAHIKKTRRDGS